MVAHKPRNSMLPGGVPKLSRSAVYKKRALYKRQKVQSKASVEPAATHKTKQVQGEKNGGTREVPLQRQVRVSKACFVILDRCILTAVPVWCGMCDANQ